MILRVGDFIDDLPGDQHRHDDGLPEPVAIFEQSRVNAAPSEGISMPTFSDAGASASQISVSIASNWQKKN